jgi:HPt (histidine-containing phosphotransfer) domain-containing protein
MKALEVITAVYKLDEDCELPPRLIRLFVDSAPNQMRELAEACEHRDIPSARDHAHKLKGGLYVVGASRLAEQLETLRGTLERSDWSESESLLQWIRTDFEHAIEELTRRAGDPRT